MKPKTFEEQLGELEAIVRKLEGGDLSLDESLRLFEDGVKLTRQCQERLTEAERRIEYLTRGDDGSPELHEITEDDLT